MKKQVRFIICALLFLSVGVSADTVIGPGVGSSQTIFVQSGNVTLNLAGSPYILTGTYIVPSGNSITIDAGVVIKGDFQASLLISRGAQIFATGTALNPIVFTSNKSTLLRARGDWGGLVILGDAPTNRATEPQIEGFLVTSDYFKYGNIGGGAGLGDATDNSGTLQYVRIEYAGARMSLNNEINGLTMGGVGSGTTMDHIMVSYSNDDAFEWFGGTVNAKYLVAFGTTDDDFDTDFGFIGKIQFGFALRDPNVYEYGGGQSNGFESDNDATGTAAAPETNPIFSNMTIIGPARTDAITTVSSFFEYGAVIRRNTAMSLFNSVIAGYRGGLTMRDAATYANATSGADTTLRWKNVLLHKSTSFPLLMKHAQSSVTIVNADAWFKAGYRQNDSLNGGPSTIGFENLSSLNNPDPRPATGSILLTSAADFANDPYLSGGYWTVTTYRGAFEPTTAMSSQWTANWTDFTLGTATLTKTVNFVSGWNLLSAPVVLAPGSDVNSTIFGATVSKYTGAGYSNPSTYTFGDGYWVFKGSAGSFNVTGNELPTFSVTSSYTIPSTGGWVLVGSVSASRPVSSVSVSGPTGVNYTAIWTWNGTSYEIPTTIEPGKAYWLYVKHSAGAPAAVTVNVQ